MPGKGHFPSFEEQLVRTVKANTTRTVGGRGSMASPSQTRDRVAASRRGVPGLPPTARLSHVQGFSIADDSDDSFTLTYVPILNSWNLMLNGQRVHRSRFTITGRTLTILDPADLFLGADTQGTPWDLEIQYDYLAGVPVGPGEEVGVVGSAAKGGNNPTLSGFTVPEAGDLLLLVVGGTSASITTPSGFTQYGSDITTPNQLYRIFTKSAAGGETSIAVTATGTSGRVVAGLLIVRGGSILAVSSVTDAAGSPQAIPVGSGFGSGDLAVAVACVELGTAVGRVSAFPSPYGTQVAASEAAAGTAGVQGGNGHASVGIGTWPSAGSDNPADNLAATGTVNRMNIRTLRIG